MKTSTGLKYVIIKKNGGKKPSRGTTINIDYTGYLEDGQLLILVLKVKRKYLVNWTLWGGTNGYQQLCFKQQDERMV
jgi:peptidylprolyl isomerase